MIDHTLLAPEATPAEVANLAREGQALGVAAVCVSPTLVRCAAQQLRAGEVAVASVVGFPSGAHTPAVKAAEAARAIGDGAGELDMVMNLGAALSGDWRAVEADIGAVRAVAGRSIVLKVIIESALLCDAQIVAACRAAESAGAEMVKTSTGFHRAGGATLDAVRLMASTFGGPRGIKASGGIRDAETALQMISAGAGRLGMSATRAVLAELPG
ncbi:MAG: deoxyribose-phosphate aldolase [Solirubrobacteraceae bacterium]|jgi:deoxyribose-phosphate aldolase